MFNVFILMLVFCSFIYLFSNCFFLVARKKAWVTNRNNNPWVTTPNRFIETTNAHAYWCELVAFVIDFFYPFGVW